MFTRAHRWQMIKSVLLFANVFNYQSTKSYDKICLQLKPMLCTYRHDSKAFFQQNCCFIFCLHSNWFRGCGLFSTKDCMRKLPTFNFALLISFKSTAYKRNEWKMWLRNLIWNCKTFLLFNLNYPKPFKGTTRSLSIELKEKLRFRIRLWTSGSLHFQWHSLLHIKLIC